MVAARDGVALTDADARAILGGMRTLPPHPDVLPAIQRLKDAGFRLAALTNSPPTLADAQLTNSGIAPLSGQDPVGGRGAPSQASRRGIPARGRQLRRGAGRGAPGGGALLGRCWRHACRVQGRVHRAAWNGSRPAVRAARHRRSGSGRSGRTHHRTRHPQRRDCWPCTNRSPAHDRPLLLAHSQRSQDHHLPGGDRPALQHQAREHRPRRAVQAGLPEDRAQQPHARDRRSRARRRRRARVGVRVRSHSRLSGGEDRPLPAHRDTAARGRRCNGCSGRWEGSGRWPGRRTTSSTTRPRKSTTQ